MLTSFLCGIPLAKECISFSISARFLSLYVYTTYSYTSPSVTALVLRTCSHQRVSGRGAICASVLVSELPDTLSLDYLGRERKFLLKIPSRQFSTSLLPLTDLGADTVYFGITEKEIKFIRGGLIAHLFSLRKYRRLKSRFLFLFPFASSRCIHIQLRGAKQRFLLKIPSLLVLSEAECLASALRRVGYSV